MLDFGEPSRPAEAESMMQYFDEQRRLGSYETMGGERAFVRWEIVTIVPAVRGISSAVTNRSLVETVFVDRDDAPLATLALYAADPDSDLAELFEQRGIRYRRPHHELHRVLRLPLLADGAEPTMKDDQDAA
jgi:hypothetical protein